jgi:hypothetical protein
MATCALQSLNDRYGHNRKGFAQSMLGTADKGPAEDAPATSAKHLLGKVGLSSEDDDETVFNEALVGVLDWHDLCMSYELGWMLQLRLVFDSRRRFSCQIIPVRTACNSPWSPLCRRVCSD